MTKSDIRICFVGDSIVNGACDPDCLGWTGRVCSSAMRAGHHVTFYNLGIRRNTSTDIAMRWLSECQRRLTPEYDSRVVFSFGANDTVIENGKRRVESEATLANARQIVTAAQSRYPCLWVGPAPIADDGHIQRMDALCKNFQAMALELSLPYLPVLNSLRQSRLWMSQITSGDGAHPQAAGYKELANLVQAWPEWWFNA